MSMEKICYTTGVRASELSELTEEFLTRIVTSLLTEEGRHWTSCETIGGGEEGGPERSFKEEEVPYL